MTSHWQRKGAVLFCCVLLHPFVGIQANLLHLVEAIASFNNATDPSGTELCIFTTPNSTLEDIAPTLLQKLVATYPTTFISTRLFVDTRINRVATLVLLDATAFQYEFPNRYIRTTLHDHPCYTKSAKFVVLVSGASFARKQNVLAMLKFFGILNFVVIPMEPGTVAPRTVYTSNQFSGQEYYFRARDRPVAQFFPDKLRDLHGYRFTVHGISDFPYMVMFLNKPHGVVINYVDFIVRRQRNGTTYYTQEDKLSYVMDARFNGVHTRRSFEHTFYFREQSGVYLVCPLRQKRDFLQHLLKPFSPGIWLILAGLFVCCRLLEHRFPATYRYDLIGLTFFGGGGIEYENPFPFRVVTLTLAVLVFFLSEAYNTKIISLMSFSKFYVQPQTLDAVAQSDYRVLSVVPGRPSMFGALERNFLSYRETVREERRLGLKVHEVYCSMMTQGTAWTIISTTFKTVISLYIVEEPIIVDRQLLQFHQHSPFFELFQNYFHRFNDVGLWSYMVTRYMDMLRKVQRGPTIHDQLHEVIFFFDDLKCVWILIIVGWLISSVVFTGEFTWHKLKRKRAAKHAQLNWPLMLEKKRTVFGLFTRQRTE